MCPATAARTDWVLEKMVDEQVARMFPAVTEPVRKQTCWPDLLVRPLQAERVLGDEVEDHLPADRSDLGGANRTQ
ncbi:hypothetical protein GCM10012275_03140 [Longimycelium tulufanense]|uniref:Uncharacterized protein n=1 Tax=Longimycelium tulufanense TaxID=907463 RepID=A0A8J3FS88_9PSEU|nr:hypothetical protein GCM10012275_03140 [Longimycelium tulufanense]